jgi:hypothetical protein
MIDIGKEQPIGLYEGAKLYPSFRKGRPTHISTLLRHITKGIRLASGEVIQLEGARLGGRWITSVEAVQRFMERSTAVAFPDVSAAPASRTSRQRRKQLDRVAKELADAGI